MQDQQFIQQWTAGHSRFSTDLDRGLNRLGAYVSRRTGRRTVIDNPYGIPSGADNLHGLSPAAQASLRGFAASVITAVLWVVVIALATPAPGLAASPVALIASAQCIAHPFLA